MTFVAAAVAGTSALMGVYSANKAAGAQRHATDSANALESSQYNQTREDQAPWRDAGGWAVGQLRSGLESGDLNRDFSMADFQGDPGYQFRQQEGQAGVENSAASRGMLLSGATLKALSRYNQDYASNEFGNAYNRYNMNQDKRFNRLASVAGIGQNAANTVANAGMNYANNASQNILGAGNATAAGYMGAANAISGGLSQGANLYQGNQMMNWLKSGNGGISGSSSAAPAPTVGNTGMYIYPNK